MLLIREFRPIDLRRVYEIECKSFKDPYDVISLLNLYEMYPETFLVALKGGFVVGYVISRVVENRSEPRTILSLSNIPTMGFKRTGHILAIAVDPSYRKQYIGTSLMEAVIRKLEEFGVANIWLEVRVSNKGAIHFYKKLNFKEAGVLHSYYTDGEDAIILKKAIYLA